MKIPEFLWERKDEDMSLRITAGMELQEKFWTYAKISFNLLSASIRENSFNISTNIDLLKTSKIKFKLKTIKC